MRKKVKLLLIAVMFMLTSGCVKMNATMEIKKDKSMSFDMVTSIDKSYLSSFGLTEEKDFDESEFGKDIKNKNCSSKVNNDTEKLEAVITCNIANIDDVSSEKDLEAVSFSSIYEEDNAKIFLIKKGFLKNTYTVKFDNSSDGLLNSESSNFSYREEDDDTTLDDDYDYDYESDDDYDYESDDDYGSDFDLSALTANMDAKFEVKLPYEAISSNATSKEDNGKHLTWDFMEMSKSDSGVDVVEFSFAIYNITNIIICAVLGILVLGALVFFILKSKKNKKGITVETSTTDNVVVSPVNPVSNNEIPVVNATPSVVMSDNTTATNTVTSTESVTPVNTVTSTDSVTPVNTASSTDSVIPTNNDVL